MGALRDIFVVFDYKTEVQPASGKKFYLQPLHAWKDVPFLNNQTDCIVLEIKPTNGDGESLPFPFKVFSIPHLDRSFWFISHSGGEHKHTEKVNTILNLDSQQTQKDIKLAREKSAELLELFGKDTTMYKCESGENKLDNRARLLFHTSLGKGGSGSPGVVQRADGSVTVVTMLLHGYPDWYYNDNCRDLLEHWDKRLCVEQGALMSSIYNQMKEDNLALSDDIFQDTPQTVDENAVLTNRILHG